MKQSLKRMFLLLELEVNMLLATKVAFVVRESGKRFVTRLAVTRPWTFVKGYTRYQVLEQRSKQTLLQGKVEQRIFMRKEIRGLKDPSESAARAVVKCKLISCDVGY